MEKIHTESLHTLKKQINTLFMEIQKIILDYWLVGVEEKKPPQSRSHKHLHRLLMKAEVSMCLEVKTSQSKNPSRELNMYLQYSHSRTWIYFSCQAEKDKEEKTFSWKNRQQNFSNTMLLFHGAGSITWHGTGAVPSILWQTQLLYTNS